VDGYIVPIQFNQIMDELRAIRDELAQIHQLLEPKQVWDTTIIYPEAGEHLVRQTDDDVLRADNKACRRCGRYTTVTGGHRSKRHMKVVEFLDGKATSCPNCFSVAINCSTLQQWLESWKGPKFT